MFPKIILQIPTEFQQLQPRSLVSHNFRMIDVFDNRRAERNVALKHKFSMVRDQQKAIQRQEQTVIRGAQFSAAIFVKGSSTMSLTVGIRFIFQTNQLLTNLNLNKYNLLTKLYSILLQ